MNYLSGLLIIVFSAIAAPGQAQPSLRSVPSMGVVVDRHSQTLRPIFGLPGAAVFGPEIPTEFRITDGVIGHGGQFALVTAASGEAALLPLYNPSSAQPLPQVGQVSALGASASGTSAVLVNARHEIFVASGFASGKADLFPLGVSAKTGPVTVSDDGEVVATVLAASGQLLIVGRDGSQVPVETPDLVTNIAFAPFSHDLLLATNANEIWLATELMGTPTFSRIAGPGDGVATPSGLGFSADGTEAIIANTDNNSVVLVNVRSRSVRTLRSPATPTRLFGLTRPNLFALADLSDSALYLLDLATGNIVFVPASRAVEEKRHE
jgi:hypothetical protein